MSRQTREAALRRLVAATRAAQSASDLMDEAFADFVGINRTDARCLDAIDQNGTLTTGDLARYVGLTSGAMTTVIDRLEAAGLVRRTRSLSDRRKVHLELTAEAHRLGTEVYGPLARAGQPLVERLSDEQIATITEYLEMSRRLNLAHARAVRDLTVGKRASLRRRLDQARRLREEAKGLVKEIKSDVRGWMEAGGTTGTRWVRDEAGNWVKVLD